MDGTPNWSDYTDSDPAGSASVADALAARLVGQGDPERGHWSEAAQQLIAGLILYSLHKARSTQARVTLRSVHDVLSAANLASDGALWTEMAALATVIPAAAAAGMSMMRRSEPERAGVVATAEAALNEYLAAGLEPDCERAIHTLILEAHRFAALAAYRAVNAFLRARLSAKYSLPSETAVRLMWLMDVTDFLLAAVGGDSTWNRTRTRPQLARLDAEVGIGSLWQFAWSNGGSAEEHDLSLNADHDLPKLLATYDAAFAAWLSAVHKPQSISSLLN